MVLSKVYENADENKKDILKSWIKLHVVVLLIGVTC